MYMLTVFIDLNTWTQSTQKRSTQVWSSWQQKSNPKEKWSYSHLLLICPVAPNGSHMCLFLPPLPNTLEILVARAPFCCSSVEEAAEGKSCITDNSLCPLLYEASAAVWCGLNEHHGQSIIFLQKFQKKYHKWCPCYIIFPPCTTLTSYIGGSLQALLLGSTQWVRSEH